MRNVCDKPCNMLATTLSHYPCISRRGSDIEVADIQAFRGSVAESQSLGVRQCDQRMRAATAGATTMRHPSLRELAAKVTQRQPATLGDDRRRAVLTAALGVGLEHWRAALVLGRLHLCGNCSRYTFGTDPASVGGCAVHGEGPLAFIPFHCPDFVVSCHPTLPAYVPDPDGGVTLVKAY
jgi:hypothetical protein